MKSEQETEEVMKGVRTELLEPLADLLVDAYYTPPPPNPMVSEKAWREKTKKEIVHMLEGTEVKEQTQKGSELIFDYVTSQLPPVDAEKIQKEWESGCQTYEKYLIDKKAPEALVPTDFNEPTVEEIMKLSPETMKHFFEAGVQLYQNNQYADAVCVFKMLSILNYRRHNIWMALGMALQQNKALDPALEAFGMAVITNNDDPAAYVHAAECCIDKPDLAEAATFLEMAQEAAAKAPAPQSDLVKHIDELKKKCA